MVNEEVLLLAQKLWDYHHLNHTLEKADIIFVLCSHDLRVADYAAELFCNGYASLIVFSGGIAHKGDLIETPWDESEAEVFAKRAVACGVSSQYIIVEDKATNCGENVVFTKKLLEEKSVSHDSIIAVQKPYMERRTYATLKKYWPDKQLMVTSPLIPFEKYPTEEISLEKVINIMVGDLQRIRVYAERGFQIQQEIPEEVWHAHLRLIELGFNKHLV